MNKKALSSELFSTEKLSIRIKMLSNCKVQHEHFSCIERIQQCFYKFCGAFVGILFTDFDEKNNNIFSKYVC